SPLGFDDAVDEPHLICGEHRKVRRTLWDSTLLIFAKDSAGPRRDVAERLQALPYGHEKSRAGAIIPACILRTGNGLTLVDEREAINLAQQLVQLRLAEAGVIPAL